MTKHFWFILNMSNAVFLSQLLYMRLAKEIVVASDGCLIEYWRFLTRRKVFIEIEKLSYSYKKELVSRGTIDMVLTIHKEDGRSFTKLRARHSFFRHDEIMEVIQAFKDAGVKEI